ncbi:MAG: hypothetical protein LBS16_05150 [Prevotellaceae bacterium]|jgi:hypothetical protein|nr:hypothetical protein [Prevotellaceae bacterium]
MPYRRLPKTDQARMRTLQTILSIEKEFDIGALPVSFRLLNQAKTEHAIFAHHVYLYSQSYEVWFEENKKYQQVIQNIRIYISHFIQVYNMAISRREFKAEGRQFYELPMDQRTVPDLSTDQSLLVWGKRLIDGERERIRCGGAPMTNPSIGKLQVHYEIFRDFKISQQTRQQTIDRNQEQVVDLRNRIDALIEEIWNCIEDYYKELPPYSRLQACSKCGVIYYYRTGEKELTSSDDIDLFSDLSPE